MAHATRLPRSRPERGPKNGDALHSRHDTPPGMANVAPYQDEDSDYEFTLTAEEEALVTAAIAQLSPEPSVASPSTTSSNPFGRDASELVSASLRYQKDGFGTTRVPQRAMSPVAPGPDVSYPDLSEALQGAPSWHAFEPPPTPEKDENETTLPPIQRFRTFPRKPFSVSDFTAGAWCELQYHYVLTRLKGRKVRTAAMKGGTKVHEKLEDEIYTTVRVDVQKKEDGFGLRIWNIIQGLRTLRDTGLTRELEVWGLVDGNVVNGVIDGLSDKNPDPEFEDEVRSSQSSQASNDPKQAPITNFFPSQGPPRDAPRKLTYITDVKTRASKVPPKGAQVRSTKIQLFLYHRFLSGMAAGTLDYMRLFRRYGVDPDELFSDVFMAQIGALHDEVFVDAPIASQASRSSYGPSSPPASTPIGSVSEPDLLQYRSLRALVGLLSTEMKQTFPHGADSIGPIVAVEYRSRAGPEDEEGGSIIGENLFAVDNHALDEYLARNMQWWNGDRPAQGVPIDETFKCRFCDFVGDCEWRTKQDQELLTKARTARVQVKAEQW